MDDGIIKVQTFGAIPALQRLRPEDRCKFKAYQCYKVRPYPKNMGQGEKKKKEVEQKDIEEMKVVEKVFER